MADLFVVQTYQRSSGPCTSMWYHSKRHWEKTDVENWVTLGIGWAWLGDLPCLSSFNRGAWPHREVWEGGRWWGCSRGHLWSIDLFTSFMCDMLLVLECGWYMLIWFQNHFLKVQMPTATSDTSWHIVDTIQSLKAKEEATAAAWVQIFT